MQELLMEKQKADEEAEAASKNTVIKVLMGEVQVFTQLRLSSTGCLNSGWGRKGANITFLGLILIFEFR